MTDEGRGPLASLRGIAGSLLRRTRAELDLLTGESARARARLDGRCAAVLMYHRVLPAERARQLHVEPGMFVTPGTFARHLDWLMASFSIRPLHEIVAHLESGEPLPRGACAITFDDGWHDNLEHALPALRARRAPATIFVVSDRVGTAGAFWPDEVCRRLAPRTAADRARILRQAGLPSPASDVDGALQALKQLDEDTRAEALTAIRRETAAASGAEAPERELLDWSELDRLAEQDVAIESHAASHAILTGVPRAKAREELQRSLARLRERGHARHGLLAYPSGAFDDGIVELAREAGYRAAFTTQVGLASRGEDPLRQPRVAVHEDISRTRAEFLRFVPGSARAANAGAGR